MTTEIRKVTDEAQIRKLIDNRARAINNKDINGLMSNYAPDVVEFDAVNPLQHIGLDGSRKRAEQWLSAYQGLIGYDIRDLSITAGEEVAFCHFLYHISGTMTNGSKVNMWVRATICYRKIEGSWLVTHEHNSVPFDGESGQASLDLKP